jgi:hypothetical protein
MTRYEFYFDQSTIDYYVDYNYLNGWASTALRVYEYVTDECEWEDEKDLRNLFLDLLNQIEDKLN